ncbi:hypothetical protein ACQ4N7_06015 [Nodosilinea sp. AN01ver1]|uniref:hypothetical protein n=1 Tax=Nodosilinea sp. AN01ver1 TaxID=3423362 RepID=UPI003D320984
MDFSGISVEKVNNLANDGKITKVLAEELIKKSAYWYEHPAGYPVNAPGHAKHIRSPEAYWSEILGESQSKWQSWRIDFGANVFEINRAVDRCQKQILDAIETAQEKDWLALEENLHIKVRQSVTNFDGHEYDLFPVNVENHMIFGSNSIYVTAFVRHLISESLDFSSIARLKCGKCGRTFLNRRQLNYHRRMMHRILL